MAGNVEGEDPDRPRDHREDAAATGSGTEPSSSGRSSARFELYEDVHGEWRWRLVHRNGTVLADSGEGYGSRTAAEEAVASVRKNAPGAAVSEY